jgi:hypothetical protein
MALVAFALAIPWVSDAETASDLPTPFAYGAQQFGLLVGGGFGLPIFGAESHELRNLRMLGVFGRWGVGLSDPLARGEFYEGNLEFDVEPMVLLNYVPRDGWAAGGSLLLHYNFFDAEHPGAIVPFIEGGGGGAHLAFRLEDGEADGFVFPLQASVGVHALTFSRAALTASLGYYHLSNAGMRFPNEGINLVMIRIGFTAFPPFD